MNPQLNLQLMIGGRIRGRHQAAGFTLIELLSVMGIVGLLLSLSLPAVMNARAQAARLQCANNLRQIGVAVDGFHETRRHYPYYFCGIQETTSGTQRGYCLSPHSQILQWIGKTALADSIDWDDQVLDSNASAPLAGSNRTAFASSVETFLCPSDPLASGPATSYRFCAGVLPVWPRDPGGMFPPARTESARDAIDGLSQTAFASERLIGPGRQATAFERLSVIISVNSTEEIARSCYSANLAGSSAGGPFDSYPGTTWLRGSARHVTYNHFFPPNSRMQDCAARTVYGLFSARSSHPGGVNVLFGDGHVSFIANDINLELWWAIASRSNQEVVDKF